MAAAVGVLCTSISVIGIEKTAKYEFSFLKRVHCLRNLEILLELVEKAHVFSLASLIRYCKFNRESGNVNSKSLARE
jgi:hypothetical protein